MIVGVSLTLIFMTISFLVTLRGFCYYQLFNNIPIKVGPYSSDSITDSSVYTLYWKYVTIITD